MKTKYQSKYTTHGELVGYCGVDSGQIMLTDPCYVSDFKFEDEFSTDEKPSARNEYNYTYNGACSATCSTKQAGQLGNGTGVVVTSGWGDGSYPVYVQYGDDGRIVSATIVFDGGEEEDPDGAEC